MNTLLVQGYLPDGYTPAVLVWAETEAAHELEVEARWGRGVATVPAVYTLLRAEADGREYTPRELMRLWATESFAASGSALDLYYEGLQEALADGSATWATESEAA